MTESSTRPLAARLATRAASVALAGALVVACSSNNGPTGPPYTPVLPASWASAVSNAYFPLVPGTRWDYASQTEDGPETIVVEVLDQTRTVNGVQATVVRDRVYLNGSLIEDTYDWYAQDAAGNVWYLGEDSKEIANGKVVDTEGSWEWGVDGALPGVIMWADPSAHVGESYRQEYYVGEAEDWGKVVALNETVTVPAGTYTGCVKTEDWNALERGETEFKYHCPQLGTVLEIKNDGTERVELRAVSRR